MTLLVNLLENVNLLQIERVTLARMIRSKTDYPLHVCLNLATAIKEAYRLGEIRGKALRP